MTCCKTNKSFRRRDVSMTKKILQLSFYYHREGKDSVFITQYTIKCVAHGFKPKHVSFFQCFYCTCNDGANEGADFCVCVVQIIT